MNTKRVLTAVGRQVFTPDAVERAAIRAGKKLYRSLRKRRKSGGGRSQHGFISITVKTRGVIAQEEVNRRLFVLGELVINEIKRNVRQYRLISAVAGGAFLQGWFATVNDGVLVIENTQPYAEYIEYGTYAFGAAYGDDEWPEPPVKKKDLPEELRRAFPKGMGPFAVVRRVFYNPVLMQRLVHSAFT